MTRRLYGPVLLALGILIGAWSARSLWRPAEAGAAPEGAARELAGRTEPAPGHVAALAPQTTQPVREVAVSEGQRVKKDDVVIRLDDDEDQAAVKAKKAAVRSARAQLDELKHQMEGVKKDEARAALENAKIDRLDAKKTLDRMEKLYKEGSVAEKSLRDARVTYSKALEGERMASDQLDAITGEAMRRKIEGTEAELHKAEAELEGAKANLDNQTLRARVTGTVAWLRVTPGLVGRPGLALWGEIVDPGVLDVRCEVTPTQARQVKVGQAAEVRDEAGDGRAEGKVVLVGVAADAQTQRVPVVVRVDNREQRLRCYVPVRVSLRAGAP